MSFTIPSMRGFSSKKSFVLQTVPNLQLNGDVYDAVLDGDNLYIGGNFNSASSVIYNKGGFLDATTASPVTAIPQVNFNGDITCCVLDGDYFYVGGNFTTYNGQNAPRIAKIHATTGVLDTTFNPGTGFNGQVLTIAVVDSTSNILLVGGWFNQYKGATRGYIVKINKNTGAEIDVDGVGFSTTSGCNSGVTSIVLDGNNVYVGGYFTNYKGATRQSLIKINLSNAVEIDADGTGFSTSGSFSASGYVVSLAIDTTSLYVGGTFTSYKGTTRQLLAKIDKTTAALDTSFDTASGLSGAQNYCKALLLDGNNLYAAGSFYTYKGNSRTGLVKIDKTTAAEVDTAGTGFSANNFPYEVYTLFLDGNNLYAGGYVYSYKGVTRGGFVKIDKTTAAEVDPNNTGFSRTSVAATSVTAICRKTGGPLFLGGSFTGIGGVTVPPLIKVNKFTNAIDTTFSNAISFGSNEYIYSLLIDGNNLYAGGNFNTYKGATRQRIVKIDKTTAAEVDTSGTGFSTTSGFNDTVAKIILDSATSSLYVGGLFNQYKGNVRYKIAKINKTTAALDATFIPDIFASAGYYTYIYALLLDGNNLYAGGSFEQYKSKTRNGIVKIDKTTAAEVDTNGTGWSSVNAGVYAKDPQTTSVFDLQISGNNMLISGDFNGPRVSTSRSNRATLLNKTTAEIQTAVVACDFGGGSVTHAAYDASTDSLYVCGYFTSYNGVECSGLVKINGTTCELDTTFNTAMGTGFEYGTGGISSNYIKTIVQDSSHIYVLSTGSISKYNGTTVNRVVKINKTTAALDTTFTTGMGTGFNNPVHSISIDTVSGFLYVGGVFTNYNGTSRNNLVKISTTNAAIDTSFVPSSFLSNGSTMSNPGLTGLLVDPSDNALFVSGFFTTYGGVSRQKLVKLNATTAAIDTTFVPSSYNDYPAGSYRGSPQLLIDGTSIYVGNMYQYGSSGGGDLSPNKYLVKLNKTTAAQDTGFVTNPNVGVDFSIDGNDLYMAGGFFSINGTSTGGVAKINKATGALTDTLGYYYNPNHASNIPGGNPRVDGCIAVTNGLFIYGRFAYYRHSNGGYGDNGCNFLIVDKTTATPTVSNSYGFYRLDYYGNYGNYQSNTFTYSSALSLPSNDIIVSTPQNYYISSVGATNIAFLNKTDATLSYAFKNLTVPNTAWCSVIDGDYLYIGGEFQTANTSQNAQGIVKIKISTGEIDLSFNTGWGFNPTTSRNKYTYEKSIRSLAIDGDNLYVGGYFSYFDLKARNGIVKLNKNTGAEVDSPDTGFSITNMLNSGTQVNKILVDGNNLYVGGYFTTHKGNSRQYLIKIDKTTGNEVDTSGTGFSITNYVGNTVEDMLIDGDNLYVIGQFTTYKGTTTRQRLLKVDKTTGNEVDTSGTGFSTTSGFNNTVTTLLLDGNNLYIGGGFSTYKGTTRQYIVKINKTTAAEVDTSGTGFSTTSGFNNSVTTLLLDGNNLYVGGHFTNYKGATRQRIVKIDKTTAAEVDTSGTGFSTTSGFDGTIRTMKMVGGDLFCGGYFGSYKGNKNQYSVGLVAKLSPTGEFNQLFTRNMAVNNKPTKFILDIQPVEGQPDRVYMFGTFTAYGSGENFTSDSKSFQRYITMTTDGKNLFTI